jgi:hypothetical protein
LQKQLLPGTTRCIDNTPAGYYFGAGAVDSTVWVINLQGGGACQEESDCIRRSQKALGSSKYWAPTDSGSHSPFLLSDPAANPDFHDAHRVHVAYCSGDGHVGNQSKADASTWGFWFVGKANLLAIVNDLKARHGMDRATHVLLTGESAGASGTFHNADSLSEWMGPAVATKAVPVSGWFFPAETGDFAGAKDPRKIAFSPPSPYASFVTGRVGGWDNATFAFAMAERQKRFNSEAGYLRSCAEAHPTDSFVCDTMDTLFSYIQTPVFVVENQFDSYAVAHVEGMPYVAGGELNDTQKAYLRYYGSATKLSLTQVSARQNNGLFLASCFEHTGDFGASTNTTVDGTTFVPLVGDWFFDRNKLSHFVQDNCGDLPCNPTCNSKRGGGGGGGGGGSNYTQCAAALVSACAKPGTKTLPPTKLCEACFMLHRDTLQKAGCNPHKAQTICGRKQHH